MVVVNDERCQNLSTGSKMRNRNDENDGREIYFWNGWNGELTLHRDQLPVDDGSVYDRICSFAIENKELKCKKKFPLPDRESCRISLFRTAALS